MAKVVGPLNSTEARGGVGALIYNTWRGIRYVKRFTSPSQPRTNRQLAIRAFLTQYVRGWRVLGAVPIAAWNTYASAHPVIDWTGSAHRLTGCNWYCALNVLLADMGKTAITNPPTVAGPAPIANVVATPGAGTVSLAFTAHAGTAETIDVWLQGIMSTGARGKIERAKHHVYGPAETTPLVISSLTPGYYTAFLRCCSETDGQTSTFVSVTFTVT